MNNPTKPTTQIQATEHVAARSVRAHRFRFRLWHGLVLIVLIVAVGVLIVRFSHAGTSPTNGLAATELSSDDISRYSAQFAVKATQQPAVVSAQVPLQYKPNGGVGVSYVAYYVDQSLKATEASSPYTYVLDTASLNNGTHRLSAVAYDANNIVVGFSSHILDIQNGGSWTTISNSLQYPWRVIFGDN